MIHIASQGPRLLEMAPQSHSCTIWHRYYHWLLRQGQRHLECKTLAVLYRGRSLHVSVKHICQFCSVFAETSLLTLFRKLMCDSHGRNMQKHLEEL